MSIIIIIKADGFGTELGYTMITLDIFQITVAAIRWQKWFTETGQIITVHKIYWSDTQLFMDTTTRAVG